MVEEWAPTVGKYAGDTAGACLDASGGGAGVTAPAVAAEPSPTCTARGAEGRG